MLTTTTRCFGDKGDVEDITEGMSSYLAWAPNVIVSTWIDPTDQRHQPTSYRPLNSTIRAIIWQLATRAGGSSCLSATRR